MHILLDIPKMDRKNPGKPKFSGVRETKSALGELRCATGGLEAVLLSALRVKSLDFAGFSRALLLG